MSDFDSHTELGHQIARAEKLQAQRDALVAALERLLHETDDGTQPCGKPAVDAARAAMARARQ